MIRVTKNKCILKPSAVLYFFCQSVSLVYVCVALFFSVMLETHVSFRWKHTHNDFLSWSKLLQDTLKIVEKQQDSTYWPFSFFSFAFLSLKPCKLLNRGNLWLCFLLAATLIHFLSRLPASSSCWSNRPCLCVCSSSLYILTAHEVNDHSIQIISLNFFFFLISETERSLPQLVFPSLQDSHQDPGFLSAAAPPTENENWKEGLNPEVKFSF